ncbi:MAG: helix-turn-helix domain-containing protein [Tomitella sp.]|nr:helix-turn-helix domain-containing protein [Tomitella sp.]
MAPPQGPDDALSGTTDLAAVAALDEPTRRRLYEFVCSRSEAVSRDDAVAALGLRRKTAAFHLDRLAEAGLLQVDFARRNGRSGPGAGRPSKLYRRAAREISVRLPERSYELAGQLLAQAVDDAERTGGSPRRYLSQRAAALGREFGAGVEPTLDQIMDELRRHGYEPRVEDGTIVLANCPFHVLVGEHTEMVCGMNLDLLTGLLEGTHCAGCRARLDPQAGYCCVRIDPGADG